MRVRRAGRPADGRRRWTKDLRGTMQVVEVMIVGILVVAAVVAVSTINVPVTETEGFKQDNERLVKDSLVAMHARPSSSATFGSTLEEYAMWAIAGDPSHLMNYLNKTLPAGAVYNVYLDNHYGPPVPLVEQGQPPREAVAGSIQFVPKLAYTFMIPEFQLFHGDYPMNIWSLPVDGSTLLHDEGETLELGVEVQQLDLLGDPKGDPFTVKTYTHTALRKNVVGERAWPSVSIWYEDDAAPGERQWVYDASDTPLYGDRIAGTGKDAYNFTWTMRVEETAGIKVAKNTELLVEVPRGFDFNETKRDFIANSTAFGNTKWWKDWSFEGGWDTGWTITAKTKETFKDQAIWFNMSSNYVTITDTAYPYYTPVTYSMGSGAHGISHLIIHTPATPLTGTFGRELFLSTPKPIISGDTSHWGVSIGNNGEKMRIENITIRNPGGLRLIDSIGHGGGAMNGVWKEAADGTFWLDLDAPKQLDQGDQAYWALEVTAGNTNNNDFRNQDHLVVRSSFEPKNGTGAPNTIGDYVFQKRSWKMAEEWVYRDRIAPYDDIPGWPDESGRQYWVGGGTAGFHRWLAGNTTYGVLPIAASANAFGDYQGAHVRSELDLTDQKARLQREYALGENVYIKNDFSALFGELSKLDASGDVSVSDLVVRSKVYTPEMAWSGQHTWMREESADISASFGSVNVLLSSDLNADGVEDIIVVGTGGVIYALDGADGAKFWTIDSDGDTSSATLVDTNGDGLEELVVGFENGRLRGYDMDLGTSKDRELWVEDLTPFDPQGLGSYQLTDIVGVPSEKAGEPDLVVAISADTGESHIKGLEVVSAPIWNALVVAEYEASGLGASSPARIRDIAPLDLTGDGLTTHVAFTSRNDTVTLLALPDLALTWISRLPYEAERLHPLDLDGDGLDDLVVDTLNNTGFSRGGHQVFTLTGTSGAHTVHAVTNSMLTTTEPREAVVNGTQVFAVGGTSYILADPVGLYGSEWQTAASSGIGAAMGLHVVEGVRVWLLDRDGSVHYAKAPDALSDGYVWEQTLAGQGWTDALDLHVAPTYPGAGGLLHTITDQGLIRSTSDTVPTWADVAHLCPHGAVPDAGLSCGGALEVVRFHAEEDASGAATAFWVLSQEDATSRLHRFDIAAATWTQVGSWDDHELHSLQVKPDGSVWLGGRNSTSGGPAILEGDGAGAWTDHRLWRGESGVPISGLYIDDAGGGWASSTAGRVWHRVADDLWAPLHVEGMPSSTRTTIVGVGDGTPWVLGKDYAHVPLRLYNHTGDAYFRVSGSLQGSPESVIIGLLAEEGHLGQEPEAAPDPLGALTDVQWYARPVGTAAWTPLVADDLPEEAGIATRSHGGVVECATSCENMEFKAVLQDDWEGAGDTIRDRGGITPVIRQFAVNVTAGGTWYETSKVADADSLREGSTAQYSEFRGGVVLPTGRAPWIYEGTPQGGFGGDRREVVVSPVSLLDGSSAPQVVIAEHTQSKWELWVLDGANGGPLDPVDLQSFSLDASISEDDVQRLIVADMYGSSAPDIVMAGRFGGVDGAVQVWDVAGAQEITAGSDGSNEILDLIATGLDAGRQTVAYGGTEEQVNRLTANLQGDAVEVVWVTAPAAVQGKATLIYPIPMDAMYGTGIVVSELSFDITQNGLTVTQTARLVDWFDMKPPGREVPRPPIYTIQIVSWFNEA